GWVGTQIGAIEREASELVVRAGLAATPYLLRLEDWQSASAALQRALIRDHSPGTVRTLVSYLQRIWEATSDPEVEAILGRALRWIDPDKAEEHLRRCLGTALERDDYVLASITSTSLANLLRGRGRLRQALTFADRAVDYTRAAGLGAW